MITVSGYRNFKSFVKSADRTFLLLYKDGNPNNDCAFSDLKAETDPSNKHIASADRHKQLPYFFARL